MGKYLYYTKAKLYIQSSSNKPNYEVNLAGHAFYKYTSFKFHVKNGLSAFIALYNAA